MVKARGDVAIGETAIKYGKIATVVPCWKKNGYAVQFLRSISDIPFFGMEEFLPTGIPSFDMDHIYIVKSVFWGDMTTSVLPECVIYAVP